MNKKIFQSAFKLIFHFIFKKLYGKIDTHINADEDDRIEIKTIKKEKNLEYKIYEVTEGRLYTDRIHDTAVILDNKIINGPSFQIRDYNNSGIRDNIVFEKGTPRIMKKLEGVVLSLLTGGGGNDNYWHWLFDVLPRLELCNNIIDLNDIDYFILPNLRKHFQLQTLKELNLPEKKILSSEKFRHIKANKLIITNHPYVFKDSYVDTENIKTWILLWLRDKFVNKSVKNNKLTNKKIYIDRNNSDLNKISERSITNENEIKKYLLENDFISVNLSEINFIEQVDLFSQAECVVGLHGAGFANLVFCPPETKVVELKSADIGPVIENITKKVDLNYCSVVGKTTSSPKYNFRNQQGNIHVPINDLKKILEK